MSIAILYISTALIFLALDAVMLTLVMKPLFARHIGAMLQDPIRMGPAIAFYLAYVAGLVALVSLPALRADSPAQALIPAALIGAMAYGTYEFTNYATLKGWAPAMVANDLVWGTVLTAFSAWAGVAITRLLTTA